LSLVQSHAGKRIDSPTAWFPSASPTSPCRSPREPRRRGGRADSDVVFNAAAGGGQFRHPPGAALLLAGRVSWYDQSPRLRVREISFVVFVYLVCLLKAAEGSFFAKFSCVVLGILVAFEWILAGVYWVARIV